MKITFRAPINLTESNDGSIVTDRERLKALHGASDDEEKFCDYLESDEALDELDGILSDTGISLHYNEAENRLYYQTEYKSSTTLDDNQLKFLKEYTINLWQEGIGVNFAQLTITEKYDLVVIDDYLVGENDTVMFIDECNAKL